MRPATPQDRDRGVPGIARLAAWAALCAAIGAVSVVLLLARPCSAQEGGDGGPVIVALKPARAGVASHSPTGLPHPALRRHAPHTGRPARQPTDVAAGPSPAPPGGDPQPAQIRKLAPPTSHLDRAAVRALEAAMAAAGRGRREYAGLLYWTPSGYGHTRPRRSRSEGGFDLAFRRGVDFPRVARVVAIYHTHPPAAGRRADAHSPHDVEVARELGLVSYIGVVASGAVHRYDPASDAPQAPLGYPRGAHVGERVAPGATSPSRAQVPRRSADEGLTAPLI